MACFDDQRCILYSRGDKQINIEGKKNKKNGLNQVTAKILEISTNLAQINIDIFWLWHYQLSYIGFYCLYNLSSKNMTIKIS